MATSPDRSPLWCSLKRHGSIQDCTYPKLVKELTNDWQKAFFNSPRAMGNFKFAASCRTTFTLMVVTVGLYLYRSSSKGSGSWPPRCTTCSSSLEVALVAQHACTFSASSTAGFCFLFWFGGLQLELRISFPPLGIRRLRHAGPLILLAHFRLVDSILS